MPEFGEFGEPHPPQASVKPPAKPRRLTFGTVVGWAWTIIIGVPGAMMLGEGQAAAGALFLLSGIAACPLVFSTLEKRANLSVSGGLRFAVAFASVLGAGVLLQKNGALDNDASPPATVADTTTPADAPPTANGDAVAPTPVASVKQVMAPQLALAFQANEVAAQMTYGNQMLDVTGIITGIVLDLFNNPVIHLEGVNEFLPVQASFDKSYGTRISALSKGQQITVRCASLTSVISAPMLSNCSLPAPDAQSQLPATLSATQPASPHRIPVVTITPAKEKELQAIYYDCDHEGEDGCLKIECNQPFNKQDAAEVQYLYKDVWKNTPEVLNDNDAACFTRAGGEFQ